MSESGRAGVQHTFHCGLRTTDMHKERATYPSAKDTIERRISKRTICAYTLTIFSITCAFIVSYLHV